MPLLVGSVLRAQQQLQLSILSRSADNGGVVNSCMRTHQACVSCIMCVRHQALSGAARTLRKRERTGCGVVNRSL